jgi:hypothetical protein
MGDYDSLIQAYPTPSFDESTRDPRRAFNTPFSERNSPDLFTTMSSRNPTPRSIRENYSPSVQQGSYTPRFKNLGELQSTSANPQYDIASANMRVGHGGNLEDMKRSEFPPNHHLPQGRGDQNYLMPYNHAMKRSGNAERMKEIFGDHQVYTSMDNLDFNQPKKVEQFQVPETVQYSGYIPRAKILDDSGTLQSMNRGMVQSTPRSGTPPSYRLQVYNAILEYFPEFIMTKTGQHGQFAIYKAPAQCLLCNGVRFVVVIVKDDTIGIGERRPLSTLAWESFQTRWTEDDSECRKFQMVQFPYSKPDKETILDDTIRLSRETAESFKYTCDNLPLNVEILKTKSDETIADSGTVSSALEMFSTVLNWSQ